MSSDGTFVHLSFGTILDVDLSHRPEGPAPVCGECERPVCFREAYTEEGAFVSSEWDFCAFCRACGEHCRCPEAA